MSNVRTSNHAKAPKAAAFVSRMREVFGADQVTVEHVLEGAFVLGQPGPEGVVPVLSQMVERGGKRFSEYWVNQ